MKPCDRYLVGLDLGSSKVCALVCEAAADGRLHLRGLGQAASKGFRKGALTNLEAASGAIRQALELAESAVGVAIESAVIGVSGAHIKGINSRGGITLGYRPQEVALEHVRRAIEAARAISLPEDREVLHVLPQDFLLDQQTGIRNPVGMLGMKLEANVHVVTGTVAATQNLVSTVNSAGVLVLDTVFEPLAAAEACLTADERDLGVLLVDIGGGTTEWMVYAQGASRETGVILVGGEHFTNDIAIGLRIPLWEAERLKRSSGCAGLRWLRQDALVEVASNNERPARVVSRRALCEILEARAYELFFLIREELVRSGYDRQLGAGVVLTGGGAQLEALPELATQVLQLPARVGKPNGVLGEPHMLKSPAYATAVGLVLHGNRIRQLRQQKNTGLLARLRNLWQRQGWPASEPTRNLNRRQNPE